MNRLGLTVDKGSIKICLCVYINIMHLYFVSIVNRKIVLLIKSYNKQNRTFTFER